MVQFDVKRVQGGTESFMVSFDFTKTPVTQIADYIIIAAQKYKTSDIHFDPRDEGMMVRFRIDGDCQDYTFVPKAYEKNLTTRLKLMANMNITESRLPQDGAIKGEFGGQYMDMRVSALPLNTGEKIVIRILDYTRSLQGIDALGFHPKNLDKIKRMMGLPNGIILTTGATGSGKSTTTYSILQGLNKPETNVITVEDPIEMNIEGINQVQVNAEIGMTFAAALRSILRQDPNVILIGEIRDAETAQIAVRASITGHLVLSTIHTNNALATVERLLDMNVERYLLSTALSGIISQRLCKSLCEDCKTKRPTTKYEKKVFKKFMQMDVDEVWDASPKGCEHCRRGYKGRIAVHEVLELDDELKSALSKEDLSKEELAKKVYSHGTITMLQDALIKCLEGKTSFEEVYKTIEIENEDDDNYENEIETEIKETIQVDEEPKVSDDLLETPVEKSEGDIVYTPPAFTAASFNDNIEENPQATDVETANNAEATAQVDNVEVPASSETTPAVIQTESTEATSNVIQTESSQTIPSVIQTESSQTIPSVIQTEAAVATDVTEAVETEVDAYSSLPIGVATLDNTINTLQKLDSNNNINNEINNLSTAEVQNEVASNIIQLPTAEESNVITDNNTNINTIPSLNNVTDTNQEVENKSNSYVVEIPGAITPPPVVDSNYIDTAINAPQITDSSMNSTQQETNVTSSPMELNSLPSVQTGAINIVSNDNTIQGLPMTAALEQNVPSLDNTTVSTLPVANDTVVEALESSITSGILSLPTVEEAVDDKPKNTYINIPTATSLDNAVAQFDDNSVIYDTKDTVNKLQIDNSYLTADGSVGGQNFLVQKPLMPAGYNAEQSINFDNIQKL